MIKEKKTTIGYHCPFCGASILNVVDIFAMSNKLLKMKCICGESELILQITKDNKVRLTVPCIICPVTHTFAISSSTFFDKELFSLTCTFTAIGICFFGKRDKVIDSMKENEEELIKMFKAYDEYSDESDEYSYTEGFRKLNSEDEKNDQKFNFDDDLYIEDEDFFIDDDDDDDDYFDTFDSLDDFDDLDDNDLDWSNLIDELMIGLSGEKNANHKDNEGKDNRGFEIYKGRNSRDEITIDADEKILLDKIKIKSPVIFEQILSIIYKKIEENKIYCFCGRLSSSEIAITLKEDKIILECKKCSGKREIKAKTPADLEYFYDLNIIYLDED